MHRNGFHSTRTLEDHNENEIHSIQGVQDNPPAVFTESFIDDNEVNQTHVSFT